MFRSIFLSNLVLLALGGSALGLNLRAVQGNGASDRGQASVREILATTPEDVFNQFVSFMEPSFKMCAYFGNVASEMCMDNTDGKGNSASLIGQAGASNPKNPSELQVTFSHTDYDYKVTDLKIYPDTAVIEAVQNHGLGEEFAVLGAVQSEFYCDKLKNNEIPSQDNDTLGLTWLMCNYFQSCTVDDNIAPTLTCHTSTESAKITMTKSRGRLGVYSLDYFPSGTSSNVGRWTVKF